MLSTLVRTKVHAKVRTTERVSKLNIPVMLTALVVLGIACSVYGRDYWFPAGLFWDETYYIPNAYQYLNHVMFMQIHPPLGKLLIALGEYLFHPNTHVNTASLVTTDAVLPAGFSFVGVRFFPVLLASLAAVLFFSILYQICKNPQISFLFTSFYIFDNALILQSRGAMLDGPQLFFVLAALLYFLVLLDQEKTTSLQYFILGLLVGLPVLVRFNAAILLLLFIPLFFYQHKDLSLVLTLKNFFSKAVLFLLGFALVLCGVYYIHAALGQNAVDGNYYGASAEYKQILAHKQTANPLYLPIIIRDNLLYSFQYNAGIPAYSKNDPTASLPYMWPFGDRAITYRWETENAGKTVRYLYLVGNPVIWFAGLLGVISAVGLVFATVVFKRPVSNKKLFFIIVVLLSLYIIYMCTISTMSRVLYLYMYLIPLIFSLILAFAVYIYVFAKKLAEGNKTVLVATAMFILLIVAAYFFFSPLTYYEPLTKSQFLLRSWLPFWHLIPVWNSHGALVS
jgi:dolichyl-phosphate-mannose-protein mannosyltransferase